MRNLGYSSLKSRGIRGVTSRTRNTLVTTSFPWYLPRHVYNGDRVFLDVCQKQKCYQLGNLTLTSPDGTVANFIVNCKLWISIPVMADWRDKLRSIVPKQLLVFDYGTQTQYTEECSLVRIFVAIEDWSLKEIFLISTPSCLANSAE